ncbi:MAG: ATP-binding protein [Kofleriaceae bacterium]
MTERVQKSTGGIKKLSSGLLRLPKPVVPVTPPPSRGIRLRTKLVIAMVLAALVPVGVVAAIASGVILQNLEQGLREDADRQLTVGLNLVLRSIERFGDEAVQLSESADLVPALRDTKDFSGWLARHVAHVPSARLQILDERGQIVFDRMVLGGLTCDPEQAADATHPECRAADRLRKIGVASTDAVTADAWNRGVSLVSIDGHVVARAVSPVVDQGLALRGTVILAMPLDGDFADSVKGALSADVLIGGIDGNLATTFRSPLGHRSAPVMLAESDRNTALHGLRVVRPLDTDNGHYTAAAAGLLDRAGKPIGIVAIAIDRAPLATTRLLAIRSLGIGGSAALAFALILALFWSRRLGSPIAELQRGATAVSRGDLDHRIEVSGGDELTDLAAAFNQMTVTLKDNQARLAARMREIVALHDAGRAVSSVIDLDQVSRKIVDAVARTFDVQLASLWLTDFDKLRPSAARARRADVSSALATDEALAAAEHLRPVIERVRDDRKPVRMTKAAEDPVHGAAAREAGALGPLVAMPLDRKNRVVGVLAVARGAAAREFSDADLNLLTTFADQAGAAVENAQLYREVRGASEELDRKVKLRTAELTAINSELGRALADLRETQAQLVLSERMAGLGILVAGVAHEINSPTAAIRGSIDALPTQLVAVARHGVDLAGHPAIIAYLETVAPVFADRPLTTGLAARRAAKDLEPLFESLPRAGELAQGMADLGATTDDARDFIATLGEDRHVAPRVMMALTDHVYLHRTASTVRHAIGQIQRIVGALKSYSHLDQQAIRTDADLHEGLETTLTLLHHALRDIVVERRYGTLPRVPVFVDELNQVWTNLISNAQQALAGKGTIAIETAVEQGWAYVRVIDDGPGVPEDVLPRIFEPFFTTKPKGEGTGLGLGIARQIVAKHGGEMRCESVPGRTVFEVRLPVTT